MKKLFIVLLTLIVLTACSSKSTSITSQTTTTPSPNASEDTTEDIVDEDETSSSKVLVVYYSASGSTERVAQEIASELNADIFEIEPVDVYTSDDLNWTNDDSRVSKEHDDESLRDVPLKNTTVENWDSYDTVLIGYPIWWGIAAWPVDNFVKDNDFTNKTIIPFCTSASSGMGSSGAILEGYAGSGNWLDGQRFSSSVSVENIKSWVDSLEFN